MTRLILILLALSGAAHAAPNSPLRNDPSPYLAMHADDPVAWRLWASDTLEQARREDRLLFVSIGYYACYWCHVMQKESFKDEKIAAYINSHYIPVKVDRELQPALDAQLLAFTEETGGQGGWPLNVFLTPEGHPLLGTVYLPPKDFLGLLTELQGRWEGDRNELKAIAAEGAKALAPAPLTMNPTLGNDVASAMEQTLQGQLMGYADELQGGFSNQAKFPAVPQLRALLHVHARHPDPQQARFLQLTLEQMASQGLRDQLGGGFFRYTVDPGWQLPHFEKMLYDNALLASLYLEAAHQLKQPAYAQVARDTLDFMLAELATADGGFIAALSAVDERGEEGTYYLWDNATLAKALDAPTLRSVGLAWGMQGVSELEHGHLPLQARDPANVASLLGVDRTQVDRELAAAKDILLGLRRQRGLPRDHKRIAAWNGLALKALAEAAGLDSRYRQAGQRLHTLLATHLWDGKQLHRMLDDRGVHGDATLEDYAFVSQGLVAWARVSGKEEDWALAAELNRQAWTRFFSAQGWRLAETSLIPFAPGEAVLADSPMPSPSAVVIENSLALTRHAPDPALHKRALSALNLALDTIELRAFHYASQVDLLAGTSAAVTQTATVNQ